MNGLPEHLVNQTLQPFAIAFVAFAVTTYVAAIGGIAFVENRHKSKHRGHTSLSNPKGYPNTVIQRFKFYTAWLQESWSQHIDSQGGKRGPIDHPKGHSEWNLAAFWRSGRKSGRHTSTPPAMCTGDLAESSLA